MTKHHGLASHLPAPTRHPYGFPARSALGTLFLAVFLGILVRVWGLGLWPVAEDEYYLLEATLRTYQQGFPYFEFGGPYVRGLLQQYLTVPLLAFSVTPEWALRIVPVLASIATLPAIYLIGHRLGGPAAAVGAVVVFCFSLWQVEFARFGRMYAGYQFLFLWSLYCFVRVIIDHESRLLWVMLTLSFLAILQHEGAIFIIFLTAIAWLLGPTPRRPLQAFMLGALSVAAVAVVTIDFRRWGESSPPAMQDGTLTTLGSIFSRLPIHPPPSMLHIDDSHLTAVIPLVIAGIVASLAFLYARRGGLRPREEVLLAVSLACAVFHQFGLALALLGAACLLGVITVRPFSSRVRPSLEAGLGMGVMGTSVPWLAYASFSGNVTPFETAKMFLNYPPIFATWLWPWLEAIPMTTSLLIVGVGVGTLFAFASLDTHATHFKTILAGLIAILLVFAVLRTGQVSTRYTFFLHPIMLLLAVSGTVIFARKAFRPQWTPVAVWILVIVLFAISEDFEFQHLRKIHTAEYSLRTEMPASLENHYYPRWDVRSPAAFVNANSEATDLIINGTPATAFYLDHVDYQYVPQYSFRYRQVAVAGGERDYWTQARLIDSLERLIALSHAHEGGVVWLILASDIRQVRDARHRHLETALESQRVFTASDGRVSVFRIQPGFTIPAFLDT